jgi:hypothetical protein
LVSRTTRFCQLIVSERTGKPIDAGRAAAEMMRRVDRIVANATRERTAAIIRVAVADSEVANALYNNAVHNNVAAQIWWSKLALERDVWASDARRARQADVADD